MTKITAKNNSTVKRLARLAQLGADIKAAEARGAKIEEHDGSVIAVEKDGRRSYLYINPEAKFYINLEAKPRNASEALKMKQRKRILEEKLPLRG